jgi:hypothetical protein
MIIQISYPGQEVRTVDAPPHIVAHLERFGSLPPFIKLVSVDGTTMFEEKPSVWIRPEPNREKFETEEEYKAAMNSWSLHKICEAHHEGWIPAYKRRS